MNWSLLCMELSSCRPGWVSMPTRVLHPKLLQWTMSWTIEQWKKMVWSDESHILLHHGDGQMCEHHIVHPQDLSRLSLFSYRCKVKLYMTILHVFLLFSEMERHPLQDQLENLFRILLSGKHCLYLSNQPGLGLSFMTWLCDELKTHYISISTAAALSRTTITFPSHPWLFEPRQSARVTRRDGSLFLFFLF